MKIALILLELINGYKTYASVILAVVSGLGMILSKDYGGGIAQIFQALLVVFGGTTVVSMRHAVAKVEARQAA
ncbi:hypothetical protein OJF2_72690 [Aquisphaera giovannonii]|uniref:Uncharacterized protein n=1 Tax=Aquisphaera giovannonii TaxID=406548 RepID=A0A5B9WDX4_9BACT|nr:hypothetical protein [Aquisphaera giovannonii]QEH38663.1 hypothetical protein OJF2_72690 [Aquisphaera giovannonii]